MATVLVVLSGKAHWSADVTDAPKGGHNLLELAIPVLALESSGTRLLFASPGGYTPSLVKPSPGLLPEEQVEALQGELLALEGFELPLDLETFSEEIFSTCDGLFFPGGEAALQLQHENSVARALLHMHRHQKPTAAIGMGVAALLAPDDPWPYHQYAMTCFPGEHEQGYPPRLAQALLEREAVVSFSPPHLQPAWLVKDRELITGQDPFAANHFADVFSMAIATYIDSLQQG